MMTCTDAALLSIRDISGSILSQNYQNALDRASDTTYLYMLQTTKS